MHRRGAEGAEKIIETAFPLCLCGVIFSQGARRKCIKPLRSLRLCGSVFHRRGAEDAEKNFSND